LTGRGGCKARQQVESFSIEYLLVEKTSQRPIELDWPLQYREMAGLLNYVELANDNVCSRGDAA
jgi:hypothetical protein